MENSIPDWLPNWEDINNYPDQKTTTPQEWAWEFLRRNSAYQKAYREYCKFLLGLTHHDDDIGHLLQGNRAKKYNTPIQFLTEDHVAQTILEITPDVIKFCHHIHNRFKVHAPGALPNPAKSFSEAMPLFLTSGGVEVYAHRAKLMLTVENGMVAQRTDMFFQESDRDWLKRNEEEKTNSIYKKPTEILFKIDLSHNYRNQVTAIQKLLEREKKTLNSLGIAKRVNRQEYDPDLLVIHDAETMHVDRLILAKHFFPSILKKDKQEARSRVSKFALRANDLVNNGYLRIASL